ncbi:MAG: 3-phosphoshikimate 1-carboxyvinyltransferase [Gammaproteobacteria bacterium]|nr:3-phosphoshikimate 1-carboxyvinyltransferase [Gammaproteobacteria bacterium]
MIVSPDPSGDAREVESGTPRPLSFRTRPGGSVNGTLRVPGDKSISHRALMFGAIAEGTTRIAGFLHAQDCLATARAFRTMGVRMDFAESGEVKIEGVGLHGLQAPSMDLDVGNSGTSMRLLAGLLCGQSFASKLVGDASLVRRPMRRIAEPLTAMGAAIRTSALGTAPLIIAGGGELRGIAYDMPVASAQVKSCLLLAGLYAQGKTSVTEPVMTRDHTERMLTAFGYPLHVIRGGVSLRGGGRLIARDIEVPADISSAAFFMVGASIAPGSDVILAQVGVNSTRRGVIDILRLMGADIELVNERTAGGEPVADLRVRHAPLTGTQIPPALVPLAIDEFPAILVAAACAKGETVLTEAKELRVKESDRIQVMTAGLQACGIDATPAVDGMRVIGGQLRGGVIDSHGDHRIAMAFAVAGAVADGEIVINDCANVATSFPGFAALATGAGLNISEPFCA